MNKYKPTFFGLIHTLSIFAIGTAGFAMANILCFWIEDSYGIDPIWSLPFGTQYATCISWQLVMSVVFLACFIYLSRVYKSMPELVEGKWRKNIVKVLLFISIIVFLIYIIGIVHSYFSGHQEYTAFLKSCVMLGLTGLGVFFFSSEARPEMTTSRLYQGSVIGMVVIAAISGIFLTLKYAPPQLMQAARRDEVKLSAIISKVNLSIRRYYNEHKALPSPKDLNQVLMRYDDISESEQPQFEYAVKNNRSFDICVEFETDPKGLGRARKQRYQDEAHKGKGKNCMNFLIKNRGHNTYDQAKNEGNVDTVWNYTTVIAGEK